MKLFLKALAFVLNKLPKTDWKPIPLCNVYGKYGLNAPNLVGHVSAPSVTTSGAAMTYSSMITMQGQITSTGGENVSVRGFAYSTTNTSPTTSDSVTSSSGSFSIGTYLNDMTGLSPGTTYYVRAFATNSGGTGYGSTVTVTTLANTPPTVTLNSHSPVTLYYFDGSGGVTDPDSAWVDDVNAFDGNLNTYAQSSLVNGSTSSNYLLSSGTTAPSSGGSISVVRVKGRGYVSRQIHNLTVYTSGGVEALGSILSYSVESSWVDLSAPTGGWTWQTIRDLEVRIYSNGGTSFAARPTIVEIQVESMPTVDTPTPTLEFTGTDSQSDDIRYNLQIAGDIDYDTFTDTAGTTLQNHTGENATTWTKDSGVVDAIIDSNGRVVSSATSSGSSGLYYYPNISPSSADYSVIVDMTIVSPATSYSGVRARLTGSAVNGSFYQWRYGNGYLVLEAKDGMTTYASQSVQPAWPSGTTKRIELEMIGSSIKVYVDGVETLSITDANITSSGGIYFYLTAITTSPTLAFDNFTVLEHKNSRAIQSTSGTNAGFVNTVNSGDTDPFTSGQKVSYTVQSALADDTYYWRVRGIDPSGSNTYGAWSETRSFTVSTGGGGATVGYKKVLVGGNWVAKPVKYNISGTWTTKPVKTLVGGNWTSSVDN